MPQTLLPYDGMVSIGNACVKTKHKTVQTEKNSGNAARENSGNAAKRFSSFLHLVVFCMRAFDGSKDLNEQMNAHRAMVT